MGRVRVRRVRDREARGARRDALDAWGRKLDELGLRAALDRLEAVIQHRVGSKWWQARHAVKEPIVAGWSEDTFVARLRSGRVNEHSPMPWENYRLLTDSDLKSIYRYLKTVPASANDVGPDRREAGWSSQRPE